MLDNWMIESNVKLDLLYIYIYCRKIISRICKLLNTLHEKGFYKRLHLYTGVDFECDDIIMNEFATLRALEMLYLIDLRGNMNISPFPQLKEFRMYCLIDSPDTEILAKLFVNIEKIYSVYSNFEFILPFLLHSKKLKELRVYCPRYWQSSQKLFNEDNYVINLEALNRERSKCNGSSKVTIFTEEKAYLNTKYAKMRTNYEFIELKRTCMTQLVKNMSE